MEQMGERRWTIEDLPDVMTEPCMRYYQADSEVGWFIASFGQMAGYLAHSYLGEVEKVLAGPPLDEDKVARAQMLRDQAQDAIDAYRLSEQVLLQVLVSRCVDNFLSYVTELVALALSTKRHLLKSGEMVTFEEVLQYENMDDLILHLVEKRISDLSYKGMVPLQKDLIKRMDFALFGQTEALERAKRLNEVRNLIVHKRAVVDRVFLDRLRGYPAQPGDVLKFDRSAVIDDVRFMRNAVRDIDARAAARFELERPVTKETFYEQVKVPHFTGRWKDTFQDADELDE